MIKGLSGRIEHIGLDCLFQAIHSKRLSGIVAIRCPDRAGAVGFKSGEIVYGSTERIHGIDSVYSLLFHQTGTFVFEPNRKPLEPNVQSGGTLQIVFESLKLFDEWELIRKEPFELNSNWENQFEDSAALELSGLIERGATPEEACEVCGAEEVEALRAIQCLTRKEFARPKNPELELGRSFGGTAEITPQAIAERQSTGLDDNEDPSFRTGYEGLRSLALDLVGCLRDSIELEYLSGVTKNMRGLNQDLRVVFNQIRDSHYRDTVITNIELAGIRANIHRVWDMVQQMHPDNNPPEPAPPTKEDELSTEMDDIFSDLTSGEASIFEDSTALDDPNIS